MINQPAPSAEENPQPTDEERKYFAEHNNSRIIKYAEAPSATVDVAWKKNSSLRDGVYTMNAGEFYSAVQELHSQQPTVDVDALWDKNSVPYIGATKTMLKSDFKRALQEALRGSYTRQDMIRFRHFDCSDAVSGEQALRQYDTERGNSNGKV